MARDKADHVILAEPTNGIARKSDDGLKSNSFLFSQPSKEAICIALKAIPIDSAIGGLSEVKCIILRRLCKEGAVELAGVMRESKTGLKRMRRKGLSGWIRPVQREFGCITVMCA
jgi:hypothetical protein